jgi:sugar phosphate isomerase/epimerase
VPTAWGELISSHPAHQELSKNGKTCQTSVMNSFASSIPRREFIIRGATAASSLALAWSNRAAAESTVPPRFPLIGFTKPFQKLSAALTAELVAAVGWDGVEIPVRAKGQIEPERAPDELPLFAQALRQQKRDIYLVATDITSMKTANAETVLRTMVKLGIKRFRLGHIMYRPDQSPADRLKEIAPELKDLAAACKDLGLQAAFQNHSGAGYVGAPVWDVYSIIQSLDPKHIGFCFDIGHATVEGGLSWPTEARLAEPFYIAVVVKDFVWKKEGGSWKDSWCPLGQGMVNRTFFDRLKKSNYRGPISQHHEYKMGEGSEMLSNLRHDLQVLKEWLA